MLTGLIFGCPILDFVIMTYIPYRTVEGPRPNYPPEKSAKFSQINRTDILSSRRCSKLLTKHDTSPILPTNNTACKSIMNIFIGISKTSIALIPTIILDFIEPYIAIEWLMIQTGIEKS